MTPKQAWTEGYRAQTKGSKVFDNPETGRYRLQWYEGFAQSERETFQLQAAQKRIEIEYPR